MGKKKFNRNLSIICIFHSLMCIFTICLIAAANLRLIPIPISTDAAVFWFTVSLIGLVGAFLHFCRKCYTYQINDKYSKLEDLSDDDSALESRVSGYYLYLCTRPLAGLSIGPVTTMIILGGLSGISSAAGESGLSSLSEAGFYLIYLSSFVGGYTSSDIFDALSKFGQSALRPAV
ncbi:hypothetical protein [uncultured Pelagimonas sp.]|uniref:hypothetical protein n=1 Tax=uncultured Pelagimonas sp. TaxID=1618102 RepID=UPI0026091B3E|nr:hypothetical protein [uncultured Pelagimonas sp.]